MPEKHSKFNDSEHASISNIEGMPENTSGSLTQKAVETPLSNKKQNKAFVNKAGSSPGKQAGSEESVSQFDNAKESPGFLLWRVSLIWRRGIETALKPFGLTHIQFVLLASLCHLTEQTSTVMQKALADFTGSDLAVVSRVVQALQKRHLIERGTIEEDKRAKHLRLTSEGLKLLKDAMQAVKAYDESFFRKVRVNSKSLTHSLVQLCQNEGQL